MCWCVTIHKTQSLTLPKIAVNLQGVFERGQVYVALSRVYLLASLTLLLCVTREQLTVREQDQEFVDKKDEHLRTVEKATIEFYQNNYPFLRSVCSVLAFHAVMESGPRSGNRQIYDNIRAKT